MSKIKKIRLVLLKITRLSFIIWGSVFVVILLLAFTSLPFWAKYSLGKSKAHLYYNTATIVLMGGGGFPSEELMMRLWYTLELAEKYPDAKIVLTTPGCITDSSSTIFQMKQYLLHFDVDSSRFVLENEGLNTRHQAMMVHEMKEQGIIAEPVVIVSSPEHIYRSVKCFEKLGFSKVGGKPATTVVLETDLRISEEKLGGKEYIPDSGNSITIRYKFWDYLGYEIEVAREYIAIIYYKLQGWI